MGSMAEVRLTNIGWFVNTEITSPPVVSSSSSFSKEELMASFSLQQEGGGAQPCGWEAFPLVSEKN